MNLNQVTLPVRDMRAAAKFYRRLGFTQIVDAPHYARFECPQGETSFSLVLDDGEYRNGAVIYFECADLDGRVQTLLERGFEFAQMPQDTRWLWREAILFDPSGNKVKLYWAGEHRLYPPWRVDIAE